MPLQTSYNTWYSSLIKPVAAAIEGLGFKINEDPNGGNATGFMNVARAVDGSKGTRQHSGVTYLEETLGRGNISVLLGARATRITLSCTNEEITATGVEYDVNGTKYIANATKQVVLSAGV
jgi:choline dehydrogenase-like flavoprotein